MNAFEQLRDDLANRFPGFQMDMDAPADPLGPWFLDIRGRSGSPGIVVEWRAERGFGVSTPGVDDFGTGADEVYDTLKVALEQVTRLILSRGRTESPPAIRLAELRQFVGLSQGDLADRAGVGQANISRIKNRDDIKLSTLAKIVTAMGATLSIRARFPDGAERELEV